MSFYGLVAIGPLEYMPDTGGYAYLLANDTPNIWGRNPAGAWAATTDPPTDANRADMLSGDPRTVVATDGLAVYRTANGGTSWSTLTGPVPSQPQYHDIAFGANADTIYVWQGFGSDGTQAGIWKTTNGGSAWTKIIGGADFTDTVGNPGLGRGQVHVNPTRLYYTVFKAVSGATKFVHYANLDGTGVTTTTQSWSTSGSATIRSSAVVGDDDTIYAWELGTGGGVGTGSKLWRVDGATHVDITPAAVSITGNDHFTSVIGNSSGVVLAIFRKATTSTVHLYRSINLGTSWSEVAGLTTAWASATLDSTASDTTLDKLANNPANHDEWWALARAANTVLHSTDGGQTWSTETVSGLDLNSGFQILAGSA